MRHCGVVLLDCCFFLPNWAQVYYEPGGAVLQKRTADYPNSLSYLHSFSPHFTASILVVGQVIGCLLGGPISDLIGRRKSLLIFLTLSLIGWFILASSHFIPQQEYAVTLLFSGRFLHGLADSLGVSPAIMYVSEVSSVKSRGMLMNSAAIAASGGIPIGNVQLS